MTKRGINLDGLPAKRDQFDLSDLAPQIRALNWRQLDAQEMHAELQRHCLHDAIGNKGWSTELSVEHSRQIVALMRTVDGCEAFRIVPYPPIREYHVPIARSYTWLDPTRLPEMQFERRTYRLKAIEREAHRMLLRAVYEEVV